MFVLPPPPRYPTANGLAPVIETSNVLHHPEGPEYTLQVGEGSYVLRDDLQLATPPPHPSEAPLVNPNPLATSAAPPTSGVKLSIVTISPRRAVPQLYRLGTNNTEFSSRKTFSIKENEKDGVSSGEINNANTITTMPTNGTTLSSGVPAFGEGNIALSSLLGKDGLKRRKPKNNIIKSNSSFVSRVIPHDSLVKRLQERDAGGIFVFANINRAYQWLDMSSDVYAEPLAKILFTKAHMLCHDVNPLTKSATHLDVVMGSSAGDILWYEPMSQKYARINKNGAINATPVSHVEWIPGSENLFLAAHMDGTLVVYDKEKEDAPFLTEEMVFDEGISVEEDEPSTLNVTKSVNSTNQKANPVACWKLSTQCINDFAFSPDSRHIAVVTEDGYLRIIDYLQEKLIDVYSSYYGGLICVCWSPDGKYVLTGGQDDLVSIWSLAERQIVARCHGHDSWVTAVAFDPWRCDERNYRFGSVGDDCKLLLWDFSVGMLHRPKGAAARTRGSISVQSMSLQRHRTESSSINRIRSDSNRTQSVNHETNGDAEPINHAVEPRARTAQLPPVLSKVIDDHPLCWLGFEEDCIITSCQDGHIRTWDRPKDGVNGSQITLSGVGRTI